MSERPSRSQSATLDPRVFCVGTIEIVRANLPALAQNVAATSELIGETPWDTRDVLRPHVAGLVETGRTLGRRLHRAVDLALHTLARRADEVEAAAVDDLNEELLDLADELGCLLARLSTVEARFDRVD